MTLAALFSPNKLLGVCDRYKGYGQQERGYHSDSHEGSLYHSPDEKHHPEEDTLTLGIARCAWSLCGDGTNTFKYRQDHVNRSHRWHRMR